MILATWEIKPDGGGGRGKESKCAGGLSARIGQGGGNAKESLAAGMAVWLLFLVRELEGDGKLHHDARGGKLAFGVGALEGGHGGAVQVGAAR